MKKTVVFLLLAALCVSLCACAAPDPQKLHIGETAVTDAFAFTLDSVDYETPPLSTTTTMKLAYTVTYTGDGTVLWDPAHGMVFTSEAGTQTVGEQSVRFSSKETFPIVIKSYSYSGVTFTAYDGEPLTMDAAQTPALHLRATAELPEYTLYRIDPLVLVLSLPDRPDTADTKPFLFGTRSGSTGGGVGTCGDD